MNDTAFQTSFCLRVGTQKGLIAKGKILAEVRENVETRERTEKDKSRN